MRLRPRSTSVRTRLAAHLVLFAPHPGHHLLEEDRTMPLYDPLTDPPQRTTVGHLTFLRESLDRVSERLREGIAESIAHTVANAVRQTVLTLLADPESHPTSTSPSSRVSRGYGTHLWGESH